jgi:hypothetical protein
VAEEQRLTPAERLRREVASRLIVVGASLFGLVDLLLIVSQSGLAPIAGLLSLQKPISQRWLDCRWLLLQRFLLYPYLSIHVVGNIQSTGA